MIFEVELREEIGKGIPLLVEGLEDSSFYVPSAAAEGLSSLGAYRMYPSVPPLLVS
jgi:hypothetical protein